LAVDLVIQGLRRSGTTFLFDVLCADPRFDAYYEPLAPARRKVAGGGSRMRDVDFFEKIRAVRAEFGRAHPGADLERLNWGAPRDPEAELLPGFDPLVVGYLDFLLGRAEYSLLKLVRAHAKLPALAALRAELRVIHIVRDPRAVVTSFLFGKEQKNAARYRGAESFFTFGAEGTEMSGMQAVRVADCLIRRGAIDCPPQAPIALKLLGLWKAHFRRTHDDGSKLLGPQRYLLLRHEDLQRDPDRWLRAIYRMLGEAPPDPVSVWVHRNLDSSARIFQPEHEAWSRAFESLKMGAELREAGYAQLDTGGSGASG
jgi:hypothetical protein